MVPQTKPANNLFVFEHPSSLDRATTHVSALSMAILSPSAVKGRSTL